MRRLVSLLLGTWAAQRSCRSARLQAEHSLGAERRPLPVVATVDDLRYRAAQRHVAAIAVVAKPSAARPLVAAPAAGLLSFA